MQDFTHMYVRRALNSYDFTLQINKFHQYEKR